MTNVSGSIGYTLLENKHIKILILADMHDEMPYCNNGIFVSEWLNDKKNSVVLLEEVPRLGSKLKELWPSSPHTQKLKEIYMKDSIKIKGIDVRPLVIPYSWELITMQNGDSGINPDELPKGDEAFKKYCNIIKMFYSLKHDFFIKDLKEIYTRLFLENNNLGKHYLDLKRTLKSFIKLNSSIISRAIKDIVVTFPDKMEKINEFISDIMEWYTIAKIYQGIHKNKTNFIIHAGLAHTTKLIILLKKYYGFSITKENGITSMDNRENKSNGCLHIPAFVDKQMGGDYDFGFNII